MVLRWFSFTAILGLLLLITLSPLSASASAPKLADIPRGATPREIEMGNKAVAEIQKDPKTKFLDLGVPANKLLSDKLNAMAATLGKASLRPLIAYDVKVIESQDVNAFTLPNGHIYVFRGLIDLVGSDDELAGVIGHEIGHNAMMHALRGAAKAKPLNWIALAAMAAALTGRAGANVAAITPYVLTGVMSGYSVEYEKEADLQAVHEMAKTQYNPSAVVTFMNRLSAEEKLHPNIQLGIFEDHPPSPERAAAALTELKSMGLAYSPLDVTGGPKANVNAATANHATVNWGLVNLIDITTPTGAVPDAKTIATKLSSRIDGLMRADLHLYEITIVGSDAGASLVARGTNLIDITPALAKSQSTTPLALAQKWKDNFSKLFWSETLKGNT